MKNKDIIKLIEKEFSQPIAKTAALMLQVNGVTSEDLKKIKGKIDDRMYIPVGNELRDLERSKCNASLKKAN